MLRWWARPSPRMKAVNSSLQPLSTASKKRATRRACREYTSAITAWLQKVGEKASARAAVIAAMVLAALFAEEVSSSAARHSAHWTVTAIPAQKAENRFIRRATSPKGSR